MYLQKFNKKIHIIYKSAVTFWFLDFLVQILI